MKIYVAGKYSDSNIIEVLNNIREGIKMSAKVLKMGHVPFSPWLDYQFQFYEPELKVEDYYNYSLTWLKCCDAMLVLPNYENSKGTLKEIEVAKENNIPIYYSLEDLK